MSGTPEPLKVVLLPGDGLGRDLMPWAERVLRRAIASCDTPVELAIHPCGGQLLLETGADWSSAAERDCASADAILLGAVGWPTPDGAGVVRRADGKMAGHDAVMGNRTRRELFANVRPVRGMGLPIRFAGHTLAADVTADVDMIVVRENTEGLYVGGGARAHRGRPGEVATDARVISRYGAERVVRFATELARARPLRRLTCVTKSNVLEGCRLFCEVFDAVESDGLTRDHRLVDAFALEALQEPRRFDVVVTPNLFGDILSDMLTVLQGGLGFAVSANIGVECALFEPVHGSAPDIAGRGVANPCAMLLSVAWCLEWLGRTRAAPDLMRAGARVEDAVLRRARDPLGMTPDVPNESPGTTASVASEIESLVESDDANLGA